MGTMIFIPLGISIGFISGFFGIGGGGVLVPILMACGYSIKEAIGISVMQMVFSSLMGSFINYKNNLLKLNSGIYLGLGGAFGGFISGFILKFIPETLLISAFCTMLLFAIYRFFKAPQNPEKENTLPNHYYFFIGVFVGMVAISLGVGGAIFLVPIMVGIFHIDIKKAVSMGLFFVAFSSISGFISMSLNGLINYKIGLIVGTSSLLGAYMGAKTSHKTDKKIQKKLSLVLYIIMFCIITYKLVQKILIQT